MELSSLHQEQVLQPAMPGPRAQGPSLPPWQAPLLQAPVSLIAEGAKNVSLYVIKEKKKMITKNISFFVFLLSLELLLAILRQLPAILLSIITPYLCLLMILDKCTIFTCVVIPSKIMYLYFLLLLLNLGLLQLRKISTSLEQARKCCSIIHTFFKSFPNSQKLPTCFSSTFIFWSMGAEQLFYPTPSSQLSHMHSNQKKGQIIERSFIVVLLF